MACDRLLAPTQRTIWEWRGKPSKSLKMNLAIRHTAKAQKVAQKRT
jgi:hypothetical protein